MQWNPVMAWLVRSVGSFHAAVFRAFGGRGIVARNILLLTTRGRKSGREITNPLLYVERDGRLYIVASFGGSDAAAFLDTYDTAGNGTFSTQRVTAARSAGVSSQQFDPEFHQPYTDELDLGFRRQFPWNFSVDVAYVNKQIKENYALVEINGFWPDGPNQPFGGFGKVDPNQGLLYRVTNGDWSWTTYHAFQLVLTKNMS